jgi:hypothetical protein
VSYKIFRYVHEKFTKYFFAYKNIFWKHPY